MVLKRVGLGTWWMGLLILLVGVTGCAVTALLTPKQFWPEGSGQMRVDGLQEEIRIQRDGLGVPHIRAQNELDAWYGLGFVHGQDRLFQMELVRRAAFGGLAELFGPGLAQRDVFLRGLEIEQRANALMLALPDEQRAVLEAYSAGVNASAASGGLGVEFAMLGLEWSPWSPTDCGSLLFFYSWDLAMNPVAELEAWQSHLDAKTLDAISRTESHHLSVDGWWDGLRMLKTGDLTEAFLGFVPISQWNGEASNSWVIGGQNTKSGLPILANDPHLQQRAPSLWYSADLSGGDLHVAGGTMVGVPSVLIGHNGTLSWGITNLSADYVDFAVVELIEDEQAVIIGAKRQELRKLEVSVPVSGASPVEGTVFVTDIGPVVTRMDATDDGAPPTHALVMRWHALELERDASAEGYLGLAKAQSVEEGIAALQGPSMTALNIMLADTQGHIAWHTWGSLVQRKAHTGLVPYPAWREDMGWDGWLPSITVVDPPQGYLVSANARPSTGAITKAEIDGINGRFPAAYRHRRIEEMILSGTHHTPNSVAKMQLDLLDLQALETIADVLGDSAPTSELARRAHQVLGNWDGRATIDAPEPTFWAEFQRVLSRKLLLDAGMDVQHVDRVILLTGPGRGILDGDWRQWLVGGSSAKLQVTWALEETYRRLESQLGREPDEDAAASRWAWGSVHRLDLTHPFYRRVPFAGGWRMPSVGYPGTRNTVHVGGYGWQSNDTSFPVSWMASARLVVPMDDPGNATFVHPGGQSGHPRHEHWDDMFALFAQDQTAPLYFDDEDVDAHAVEELRLLPRR